MSKIKQQIKRTLHDRNEETKRKKELRDQIGNWPRRSDPLDLTARPQTRLETAEVHRGKQSFANVYCYCQRLKSDEAAGHVRDSAVLRFLFCSRTTTGHGKSSDH